MRHGPVTVAATSLQHVGGNLVTPVEPQKTPQQGASMTHLVAAAPVLDGIGGRSLNENQEARTPARGMTSPGLGLAWSRAGMGPGPGTRGNSPSVIWASRRPVSSVAKCRKSGPSILVRFRLACAVHPASVGVMLE